MTEIKGMTGPAALPPRPSLPQGDIPGFNGTITGARDPKSRKTWAKEQNSAGTGFPTPQADQVHPFIQLYKYIPRNLDPSLKYLYVVTSELARIGAKESVGCTY